MSDIASSPWSRVAGLRADDPDGRRRAIAPLFTRYWTAVLCFIRLRWLRNDEESRALTRDFIDWACRPEVLERFRKKEGGRFRAFVRVALKGFTPPKPGTRRADAATVVDPGPELKQPPSSSWSPADAMDREWKRIIIGIALERMREACVRDGKEKLYEVFKACTFDSDVASSQMEAAGHHDLSPNDLRNCLSDGRHRFNAIVHDLVAETVSTGEAHRGELRDLFAETLPPGV